MDLGKMDLGKGIVPLTNLSHVGVAVKDAESTITKFISSVWDIGNPDVNEYEPKPDEVIAGGIFRVRLVFVKFGTITWELLQPLDDKSIWAKFIKEKGEGIHHVAFGVSNYDEVVSKLQKQGYPMITAAVFKGCRWCYFNTSPGGICLELREEYKKL